MVRGVAAFERALEYTHSHDDSPTTVARVLTAKVFCRNDPGARVERTILTTAGPNMRRGWFINRDSPLLPRKYFMTLGVGRSTGI